MARLKYGVPYDPAIRKTECGKHLYNTWRRIRKCTHCKEWDYFPTFYDWALQSGYELGAWLRRFDDNEPYNEENSYWYTAGDDYLYDEQWIADWNRAVNRIRKHYGMPPLEGTVYGD